MQFIDHWTSMMKTRNHIFKFLFIIAIELGRKQEALSSIEGFFGSESTASNSAASQSLDSETESSMIALREEKKNIKDQISLLRKIKTTMEKFKQVLAKFFFASSDLEKDKKKINEIFETLREGIMKHNLLNIFFTVQTKVEKKEHIDFLNKDAVDFLKRLTDVNIETCRVLRDLEPLQESYNFLEAQRLRQEPDLVRKEAELVEREANIIRNSEKQAKKLETILQAQEYVIKRYENELEAKKAEVERQKKNLQDLLTSACESWQMRNIIKLLRDLKFANLNVIFEYFCIRNEFLAAFNRIDCIEDPHCIQRGFRGLLFPWEPEPKITEDSIRTPESSLYTFDERYLEDITEDSIRMRESSFYPFEERYLENASMFSAHSIYSRLSYGAVPWSSSLKTRLNYSAAPSEVDKFLQSKLTQEKIEKQDKNEQQFPSHPSVAFTLTQEEAEMENKIEFENFESDLTLKGILLKGKQTKLNWFNAHRTSLTALIEEELTEVQDAIAERLLQLQTLERRKRLIARRRRNKSVLYQIERFVTRYEGNVAAGLTKELDKAKLTIKDFAATRKDWLAKHKEQDKVKNDLKSQQRDLKSRRKDLSWTLTLEAEARKTIHQQGKDLVAVQRTLHLAEANKRMLASWTRQILDRRTVYWKKHQKREEEVKAKVARLEPAVETEWNRVNSSIVRYKAKIEEVKRKVKNKMKDTATWERNIAALRSEKEMQHKRIRAAKISCFQLSQRLASIQTRNKMNKEPKTSWKPKV